MTDPIDTKLTRSCRRCLWAYEKLGMTLVNGRWYCGSCTGWAKDKLEHKEHQ